MHTVHSWGFTVLCCLCLWLSFAVPFLVLCFVQAEVYGRVIGFLHWCLGLVTKDTGSGIVVTGFLLGFVCWFYWGVGGGGDSEKTHLVLVFCAAIQLTVHVWIAEIVLNNYIWRSGTLWFDHFKDLGLSERRAKKKNSHLFKICVCFVCVCFSFLFFAHPYLIFSYKFFT